MIVGLWLVLGIVIGAVGTALVFRSLMQNRMVVPQRSASSFEETCVAIEREVPEGDGWSFPIPWLDMYEKLAGKGFAPDGIKKIRLYFVCKPALAKRVLSAKPRMSAIMPCSWAVYELDDGSVWLSKMNIAMMSKLFAGDVGSAMTEVAAADENFMTKVLA